jgi:5'-nucleotidase
MRRTSLLIVAAASSLGGCLIERPQPDLRGQDVRITLIHTADIHSRLFPYNFVPNKFDQDFGLLPSDGPYGGMAKIAHVARDIRANAARSLWLDSGDCFEGAPVFNEFKGEAEMRSLSAAGVDVAVLGNHEFDLGGQNLYQKIDNWAQFPILAANYAWDDPGDPTIKSLRDVVKPYEILDVDGLKVGVIGLGNEDTLTSIFEGGNSLGFRPLYEPDVLKAYVSFLRPQVDLIVVLSHLGLDNDEDLTASQVDDPNEALPLDGIDLILGGHLHIVTNPPKLLPHPSTDADGATQYCQSHDCSTLLVHSGAFAKYVGRLDLVVHVSDTNDNGDYEKRSRIVSFAYNNIPIHNSIPDDPQIASLLWPYDVKIHQDINLDGVFAYVDPPAGKNKGKIVRNDTTGGDSQLGNLVARAMQTFGDVQAELAITNSLGIRADFEPGPLTNEQMFNVFPFENTIVVMYLSGQEIQDTFDFVAQKSGARGCQSQAQVAGVAFDMVCKVGTVNNPCAGKIDQLTGLPAAACATNIAIGDNCRGGNPLGDIDFTKCPALDVHGLYRVAVNNYIAAGGSGFIVLKRNTSQQDTGVSLRDALTVYLSAQSPCGNDILDATDMSFPQRAVNVEFGRVACLGATNTTTDVNNGGPEQHDGRIRPVFVSD